MRMNKEERKRLAVIGMGAAGCMAAISAARKGAEVHIFDGNEKPGKKIYITGKGRCNLTNACPMDEFMTHIVRNPKFLYSSFAELDNLRLMNFFEREGLPLKIERGNRVFPVSDHSSDVIKTLEKLMRQEGVVICFHSPIRSIAHLPDRSGYLLSGDAFREPVFFDAVVLASGGLSYPVTGSRGDGYRFARELGHTIVETYPSLVPIELKDSFVADLEGLSLKNVRLQAEIKGKKRKTFSEFGEMVFTRTGISGPIVLTLSSLLSGLSGDRINLYLDWKPAVDFSELYDRLIRERDQAPNRMLQTLLEGFLPKRSVPIFADLLALDLRLPVHSWTRESQADFIGLLKCFPLQFKDLAGFNQAVITRGGVSVKEIDPSSLQSKISPGLFFAGELIDVDAHTGGYNLQIAFSTGWLAGKSAAEMINSSPERTV